MSSIQTATTTIDGTVKKNTNIKKENPGSLIIINKQQI